MKHELLSAFQKLDRYELEAEFTPGDLHITIFTKLF